MTRSLAAKAFQTSLPLCKETFFSAEMEADIVERFVNETLFHIVGHGELITDLKDFEGGAFL